jgi:hypothetical protein
VILWFVCVFDRLFICYLLASTSTVVANHHPRQRTPSHAIARHRTPSATQAKTIDLCNNPLTKEPKLDAARRILPEWTGLDEEAQGVTDEYANLKSPSSPVPDASTGRVDVGAAAKGEDAANTKDEL